MKQNGFLLFFGLVFLLSGCVSYSVNPPPYPPPPPSSPPRAEAPPPQQGTSPGKTSGQQAPPLSQTPQQVASLRLVDHGEREIRAGHYDRGISLLERAISLDGYNGRAYYLLAVAWLRKRVPRRALGFAQKAELLFQGNPDRLKKVYQMESRIYEKLGQPEKARQYRNKTP